MPESFYEPGPARAEKVRALFSRIASRYDLINDLQSFGLHRCWKKRVVSLAAIKSGKALDVCCGTGDLSLALAKSGLEVTGLDFTEPMLQMAAKRARLISRNVLQEASFADSGQRCPKTGQSNQEIGASSALSPVAQRAGYSLEFIRGDAQKLPFKEGEFDVVTVGYGLRNLSDWELGLSEMHRVTRPGGKVIVLDFGKPENRLWRAVYFGYLKFLVSLLGLIFCRSARAYSYILESLHHYPAQQGVARKMRDLGMRDVRIIRFLGGAMTINYGEKAVTANF